MLKITLNETEKWKKTIKLFEEYDVYYLPEYLNAFQLNGDGNPVLFYHKGENYEAANVVILRKISDIEGLGQFKSNEDKYDIITPYGYGGFLVNGEITDKNINELSDIYTEFCRSEHIISEFVRFHPLLHNHEKLENMYEVVEAGNTVLMELHSEEDIWKNITSKNRNMIRKAEKNGIVIKNGFSKNLMKSFRVLYEATMDRDHAQKYYYFNDQFYESILAKAKDMAKIFYAEYEDKIISASIILYSNGKMHYHLSGSDYSYRQYAPTNLLLWEAAKWGCRNGFRVFHLGGGVGGSKDSLYKFKKSFNRNSENGFFIGKKVFDHEIYEELTRQAEKLAGTLKNNFFPEYRAF